MEIYSADPLTKFKYFYSLVLLVFSMVIVLALIFEEKTSLSQDFHPIFALLVMVIAIVWLSMVEGGQACMVGLPPVDRHLFQESHPITHAICEYGHHGDNLDRYLMGRQFLVLALVFATNLAGAPVEHAIVLGLPRVLYQIFLKSGLAMILITAMIGQLATQINASHCMLDYINTHFMTFTLYVAMGIEASGLLHASYLIQHFVAKLSGHEIEFHEEPRGTVANIFFWGRVVMSCFILVASFYYTLVALFEGKTTMWDGVPEAISVILFFLLMSIVGLLEGMQIAFFAVAKMTEAERSVNIWASQTCDLLFKDGGRNLPGFMVGRQLCVVSCFFVIARVTTINLEDGQENVAGVSDPVQGFFDTGLMGALITTIVASIAWQLMASTFPLAFLGNPITYLFLSICLSLEATGIASGAWVLAALHKELKGYQNDDVYIGTADDRRLKNHKDHETPSVMGHLIGSAFPGHFLGDDDDLRNSEEAATTTQPEDSEE